MNIEALLIYFAIGFAITVVSILCDYLRHGKKASIFLFPWWVTLGISVMLTLLWVFILFVYVGDELLRD